MATRRNVASSEPSAAAPKEDRLIDKAGQIGAAAKNVSIGTVIKLLFFTVLMVTLPLGTYFYSNENWFQDKENPSSWAAGSAGVVANLILFAYIIVAIVEDQGEQEEAEKDAKKKE